MDGFDGPDLVLGSIYGVRHFGWDGHLKAVTARYTWSPGENEAKCHNHERRPVVSHGRSELCKGMHGPDHDESIIDYLRRNNLPLPPGVGECYKVEYGPAHRAGAPDCGCGFWAYYGEGPDSPYGNQNRIAGVIEGYGRTTVGAKGFRCEKAKIVALMVPLPEKPKEPEPEPEPLDQKAFFAAERRKYQLWSLLVVTLPWTLWNLWDIRRAGRMHTAEECHAKGNRWAKYHGSEWWYDHGSTCTNRMREFSKRERHVLRAQARTIWRSTRSPFWVDRQEGCVDVEAVGAWYPDVPIFHSMEEMLREFPTEKPDFTEEVA